MSDESESMGQGGNIETRQAAAIAECDEGPGFSRPSNPGGRPAVFLDRDGTIIEHVHYLTNPGLVRLLPGAAEAIRTLSAAGFACVVVTNQSAIGRGMLTEEGLALVHDEMNRQLAAQGAAVAAIYHCPDAPTVDDRTVVELSDRKPGPGMLFRAASALGLDLDASWMVGDLISDVLAGINARCRGSVLLSREEPMIDGDSGSYQAAPDLLAAAGLILASLDDDSSEATR